MLEYKTIQVQHIDEVHDLEKKCYPNDFLTKAQLEKLIKQFTIDGLIILDQQENPSFDDDEDDPEDEFESKVVGYAIYTDNLEVLRFGIAPEYRNKGIGTELLNKLKNKLKPNKPKLTFHIPEPNLEVQLFFANHGCIATGIEKDYFRKSHTNSYEFVFRYEWLAVLV